MLFVLSALLQQCVKSVSVFSQKHSASVFPTQVTTSRLDELSTRINDLDAKRAHDKEEILKQVADTGLELKRMLKEFKVKFVYHNMYRKGLVKHCCSRSKYFTPFLNFF